MYLKTNKPMLGGSNEENIERLANYNENLKEEIAFRLDYLAKRIDSLYVMVDKLKGDE